MSVTTNARPQPRIELPVNPADVGLAVALRAAGRYWVATPAHWVLPVVAVALVNMLAALMLGGATITTQQMQAVIVTGPQGPELDMAGLPRVIAGPVAVGLVTVVARWFLVANAIAGLRGRDRATGWIVGAGIRAFAADMIVSLAIVSVLSFAVTLGPAGLIVGVVAGPVGVYVGLRLTFWTLAIFDGQAILGGARTSWQVTRRAVLRVLGWSLAIAAIGFLASIPLALLDLVAASLPAIGAAVSGTVETLLAAWTVVVMAVLFESQRLRTDSAAYQASLVPGAEAAVGSVTTEARGPFDPPPPPA